MDSAMIKNCENLPPLH